MSQVFSGDSVNGVANVSVPGTTETAVVTGNFVNPPFGNAKAIVNGSALLAVGTGTATISVRLRRNPNAENFLVAGAVGITAAAGSGVQIAVQAADAIPDGRPVQYQLTVQQNGATGAGTAVISNVTTILISG